MKRRPLILSFLLFVCAPAFAQPNSQRFFEQEVAPDLIATWVVVDDFPKREAEAKESIKKAAQHTREVLDRLDPLNPLSETSLLLSKKEPGVFPVSPDLAQILYTTQEIARQIREPLAKKIKVDLQENQVHLKSTDVIINIEPVLKGYLADTMMNDLAAKGFPNSFLELQGVFVVRGENFNGPWKVEVFDPTTALAHHAFFYQVLNTSAATIRFDQRGPSIPTSDIKSVTVFTQEGACKAQGLAAAVYAMGLAHAKKFLDEVSVERAVLIDYDGNFHQFPEENGKE